MSNLHLWVSAAPFLRTKHTIEKIMYTVIIALLPAVGVSVYFFGIRALILMLASVAFCILFEFIINKIIRQAVTCFDGSAILTGILIALMVPATLPYWMIVVAAFVAIVLTKQLFGGIGFNVFNPALVARVFLLISFPVAMTKWPVPFSVNAVTGATPLGILKTDGLQAIADITFWKASLGQIGGSMGETSAIAILIGAIILFAFRYITFAIPVTFLTTVFIFTGIFHLIDPSTYASPLFHMVTGGLMLGVFFMATDMVTSPITIRGQIIFGIGCGLLTGVIRLFGGYPEGVAFAILIMNAFVPLLDKWEVNANVIKAGDVIK